MPQTRSSAQKEASTTPVSQPVTGNKKTRAKKPAKSTEDTTSGKTTPVHQEQEAVGVAHGSTSADKDRTEWTPELTKQCVLKLVDLKSEAGEGGNFRKSSYTKVALYLNGKFSTNLNGDVVARKWTSVRVLHPSCYVFCLTNAKASSDISRCLDTQEPIRLVMGRCPRMQHRCYQSTCVGRVCCCS
jgi:hypothetical protein